MTVISFTNSVVQAKHNKERGNQTSDFAGSGGGRHCGSVTDSLIPLQGDLGLICSTTHKQEIMTSY